MTLAPTATPGARALEPLLRPAAGANPAADARFLLDLLSGDLPVETMKWEVERFYLVRLIRGLRGDRRRMMEALKWKRSYLHGRLKELGIDIRRLRQELWRE